MIGCAFALALATAAGAFDANARSETIEAIDAYVDAERRALRIPGLALGVVHGDDLIHVATFGSADRSRRRVADDTPFVLGSTSKSFTALATMQLVEAGRIDLDAPVQRYIPWFHVADAAASASITVRHLLNQTSGFSTAAGRATLLDVDDADDALERRVRALANVALTAPVGANYQYSNCNYQVLGLLVQEVSGRSYEAYLQAHVFDPLQMRSSFTSKSTAVAHGLAVGNRAWLDRPQEFDEPFPRASVAQGFVISSARDMTRYLAAQLNGGRVQGIAILSPGGIAEMHRGAATVGEGVAYGMGWNVGKVDGVNAVWHGGDTFSYQSFMLLLPDERTGVVLLANMNDIPAGQRFQEVATNVVRLLNGRSPTAEHAHTSDWLHAFVVGLFLAQLAGIARTVQLVRRWRSRPSARPGGRTALVGRVVLPALFNVAFALIVFVGLPMLFAPLRVLIAAVPDIAGVLVLGASIALIWSIARTVVVYRSLMPLSSGVNRV